MDAYSTSEFPVKGLFPKIEDDLMHSLHAEISLQEVRQALFSMAPLKALGMDEIHAKFYQTNWDIVGNSIFNMVQNVFMGGNLDLEINRTLLVLIPKCVRMDTIAQFGLSAYVQFYISSLRRQW